MSSETGSTNVLAYDSRAATARLRQSKHRSWAARPMSLSSRQAAWRVCDLAALTLSYLGAWVLAEPGADVAGALAVLTPATVLGVAWTTIAQTTDLYHPRISNNASRIWMPLAAAGVGSLAAVGVATALQFGAGYATHFTGVMAALLLGLLGTGRAASLYLLASDRCCWPVVLAGTPSDVARIAPAVRDYGAGAVKIVGLLLSTQDATRADAQGAPVVNPDTLVEMITAGDVRTIVASERPDRNVAIGAVLRTCADCGAELKSMETLYEELTGRVALTAAMSLEELRGTFPSPGAARRAAKRAMDLVLASVGSLGLILVLPFLVLAIRLDSPGPVLYKQERVGRRGKRFLAYKFRSMVEDAERGVAVWAKPRDPRVTRVGRFLRKTHLDEFPQFFNILKGDMSVVGPRPERPEFVSELTRQIPLFDARHLVKPGMAGWALVNQGYGASLADAAVKLEYDLYYIKHQSMWFDLVIFLKTFVHTFAFRGRG